MNGDPSSTDLTVLSIMGPSGIGLFDQFDGDANGPSGVQFNIETSDFCFVSVHQPRVVITYEKEAFRTSDLRISSPKDLLPSSFPLKSVIGVEHLSKDKWGEYLPKILYNRKLDALRVNLCADDSAQSMLERSSSSGTSTSASSGSDKAVRKRTISDEAEWVQRCQRRRPILRADKDAKELFKAKLELARFTKQELEDESKQRQELHELEMRKRTREAELLELQVLKLKKELGPE